MVTDFQVVKNEFSTIYRVLDIETGEVLFEREEENINKAFSGGLETVSGYMTVRRQIMADGRECRTVECNGDILCVGWNKPLKTRKRGGKKSYVKLYPDKIATLKDEVINGLIKLAPFIMPDGTLKDRKRRRYLSKTQALAALGFGRDKNRRLWQAMIDSGVLFIADGIIHIDREYLARG